MNFKKSIICFFLIALLSVVFMQVGVIRSEANEADIRNGIRQFQTYINSNLPLQYLGTPLAVDGYAGPLTQSAAVKLIQYRLNVDHNANLEVDGYFGPASQFAFEKNITKIQLKDYGFWVYILQGLLYCHNYDPKGFDGSYGVGGGTGCLNAVNQFEADKGITEFPDTSKGPVGVETMSVLCWKTYIRPTITLLGRNIEVGKSEKIYYFISPEAYSTMELVWSSKDPYVATVTGNGIVNAIRMGNATITAKSKINPNITSSVMIASYNDKDVFELKSFLYNNGYADVFDQSYDDGTGVITFSKNSQSNQLWRFQCTSDGYFVIRPMHTNDVFLHIESNTYRSLALYLQPSGSICVSNNINSDRAKWKLKYISENDTYTILSKYNPELGIQATGELKYLTSYKSNVTPPPLTCQWKINEGCVLSSGVKYFSTK